MVLPGAGSSADFVRRAFLRPLREAGYGLVTPEPVPGPDLVPASFRALDAAAAEYGPRLRLVGGVGHALTDFSSYQGLKITLTPSCSEIRPRATSGRPGSMPGMRLRPSQTRCTDPEPS